MNKYIKNINDKTLAYAEAMADAGLPEYTKGPRLAFYTTPENQDRIGYQQTDADRKMNYIDPVDDNPYAWISDKGLKATGNLAPKTIGELVDHPKLFKAYPELKDTPVVTGDFKENAGMNHGMFFNGKLHVNDPSDIAVAMHEIQHYIQTKEGWFGKDDDILDKAKAMDKLQLAAPDIGEPSVANMNNYLARDDEAQAHLVDRVLVNGIPETGALSNIRSQLGKTQLNPMLLREPGYKEAMLNNNQLSMSDYLDYTSGDYKYKAVKGSKNKAAQGYPSGMTEDGMMLDDAVFTKQIEDYTIRKLNESASMLDSKSKSKKSISEKAMENIFRRSRKAPRKLK